MASKSRGSVSCVFVDSFYVPDLAQRLQLLLPSSVRVEELHFPGDGEALKSEDMMKRLGEIEVLVGDSPTLLQWLKSDALPNLKWIHQTHAGVEITMKGLHYQKPKADLLYTRTAQAYADVLGEFVIGQIIAWEKNFSGMMADQERRIFDFGPRFRYVRSLSTLSIGILGFGSIGTRVAEICKAMRMTVWAVTRVQKASSSPHVDHFRAVDSLAEVLQNVDYLCSVLPDTPDTCDLLSGQVLKPCQKKIGVVNTEVKTILISVGRGNVISDESIVRAIREGWLGGAILDVFNQEPLPPDSDLWTLPNVVITPHVSGPPTSAPVAESFVENLKLYLAGQPLQDVVDWDRGY